MMDCIGIVVPVYKVEAQINRCIDSILRQTYEHFQLVLVDDGSPDDSGKICDLYAEKYDNITVIHKQNGGLSSARNAGIDWLTEQREDCKWITFIDSDDWICDDYLEVLLKAALQNGCRASIGKFIKLSAEQEFVPEEQPSDCVCVTPEAAFISNDINTISACGKLYDISLFAGIRFPEGKIHEDRHTTYKLLFKCDKIAATSKSIYVYTYNPNSISHSKWTLKYSMDNVEAVEGQLEYFKTNGYPSAWNEAAKLYVYLLVSTLRELHKQGKEYRANYRDLRKRMKRFTFQNRRKLDWSRTLFLFLYTYPLLEPLYKMKHMK